MNPCAELCFLRHSNSNSNPVPERRQKRRRNGSVLLALHLCEKDPPSNVLSLRLLLRLVFFVVFLRATCATPEANPCPSFDVVTVSSARTDCDSPSDSAVRRSCSTARQSTSTGTGTGTALVTEERGLSKQTIETESDGSCEEDETEEPSTSTEPSISEPHPTLNSHNHNLSRPRSRTPNPNALYRFLLRQGRIGHVMVMLLVLLSEFIALYIPPLAAFLTAITTRLLPSTTHRTPPNAHLDPSRRGNGSATAAAALATADRTGQSKRQKRAWTQQADQLALQQLQRLGVLSEAKYRHVSTAFLQRHGLSAASAVPVIPQQPSTRLGLDPKKNKTTTKTTIKTTSMHNEPDVESESDVDSDWVLEALLKEDYNKHKSTLSQYPQRQRRRRQSRLVQPTVSVSVGSRGSTAVSIGLEMGAFSSAAATSSTTESTQRRRTKSPLLESALTSRPKRKATMTAPRRRLLSDREGGDGILGRIRAVAGTDSRLSRSLLGAYPGDAVPPSQAASPQGVTALAERYGWGDWSDSESDDNNNNNDEIESHSVFRASRSRRLRQRKRRTGSHASVGISLGASALRSSLTDDAAESWSRTTPAFISRTRHTLKSDNTKASSNIMGRRSTLQSLNERRLELPSPRKVQVAPLASSPTLGSRSKVFDRDAVSSSSNENNDNHKARSSITRPALRTLNEHREQKTQAKKRRNEE